MRCGSASNTGITSLADLKAAKKEIVIGALNARSENAVAPKVLAAYEHWPLKVVTGYAGFHEVLIAMERGEVDGLFSHEGSVANSRPDMIASGFVKPIAQSYDFYPNVPVLPDVVTDDKTKALLGLVTTPSQIGLPLHGTARHSGGSPRHPAQVLHAADGGQGVPRGGGPSRPAGRTRHRRRRVAAR